MTRATELAPGTELDGTYRIVEPLGEGGMGAVYVAELIRLPKRVALKVLHVAADEGAKARFRREAEIAAKTSPTGCHRAESVLTLLLQAMKPLTVYYRPSCAFSVGAINFLLLRGAEFRVVNLNLHTDEEARVDRELGDRKLETPVLEVEGRLWVAPSNSELKDRLQEWGLETVAAPYKKLKEAGER